jgi:hypothetical protein
LKDDAVTGYLPAVIYTKDHDEAEIFVGRPLGVNALTTNGGSHFNYESSHRPLLYLFEGLGEGYSTETGHVIETQAGERSLIAKHEATVDAKIRHGQFASTTALQEEYDRLGLLGFAYSDDVIHPDFQDIRGFNFTQAIREAAKWVEHTHIAPYDSHIDDRLPRTLTIDEASLCLSVSFQNIKAEKVEWDIDTIRSVVTI